MILGRLGPEHIVRCGEAGGGDDGGHLEEGVAQALEDMLPYWGRMSTAMATVARATTTRKKRSSSLLQGLPDPAFWSTRKYRAKLMENSSMNTEMMTSITALS